MLYLVRMRSSSSTRILRILAVDNPALKAGKDRISGILRYAATKHNWSVRILANSNQAHVTFTPRDWDGAISDPGNLRTFFGNDATRHLPFPVVSLDASLGEGSVCRPSARVSIDDDAIARAALRLVLRAEIKSIAYIQATQAEDLSHNRARETTLRAEAAAQGFHLHIFKSLRTEDWAAELERLARWLAELPHPCGVVAFNDERARTTLDACRLARLQVPEQIRLVGVDNDIAICENLHPTLSSVLPDFEAGGYLAAQTLDDLLVHGCPRRIVQKTYGVREVVERASTQDVHGCGRLAVQAREYIRLHAGARITVTDVAQALNVNRRTLELHFRAVFKCGIGEELRHLRLARVAHQLRETDKSITEIALGSGFASPSHLKALFRKTYGCTMRAWRFRPISDPRI